MKSFVKSIPCSGGVIFEIKIEETPEGHIISNFEMSISSEGNISTLKSCWINPESIENLGLWLLDVRSKIKDLQNSLHNK